MLLFTQSGMERKAEFNRRGIGALARLLLGIALTTGASTAQAQSPIHVTAPVSGRSDDRTLTFQGSVTLNTITRSGVVIGRLGDGTDCTGRSSINFFFTSGEGTLTCGSLSASFTYRLLSQFPPRGEGTATISDGRRATLKIGD